MTDNGNRTEQLGPSEFSNWKTFLVEKSTLKFTLRNGDVLTGIALWIDKFNFGIKTEEHGDITIPKHAVLWYGRA
jgi:hypothetical protein